MAKKQSNTSENSAAEQNAKPGMFIPIPTAEITNAAETARIRAEKEAEEARIRAEKEAEAARKKAEKEAKKKADKEAADAVVAKINESKGYFFEKGLNVLKEKGKGLSSNDFTFTPQGFSFYIDSTWITFYLIFSF